MGHKTEQVETKKVLKCWSAVVERSKASSFHFRLGSWKEGRRFEPRRDLYRISFSFVEIDFDSIEKRRLLRSTATNWNDNNANAMR